MKFVKNRLVAVWLVLKVIIFLGVVSNANAQSGTRQSNAYKPEDPSLFLNRSEFYDSLQNPIDISNSLEAYTAYKVWDFESETVDHYDDAEIREDFKAVELFSHNRADIVMDEINGSATQVMRITHPAETVHDGFEMQVDLEQDYNELYLSYNFKFGENFNSTEGGKLPGLSGLPALPWPFVVPIEGHGFWAINMFKPGGRMISYHRDRTKGWVPVVS